MSDSLLRLSAQQKAFYDEQGYLLLERFYSDDEVAVARREMTNLLCSPEKAHPRVKFSYEENAAELPGTPDNPQRIWMIMDTPLAGDWWFRQATDPRLLDVMVDCLGPNLDFHNGKARIKPPGYSSHHVWHQDWPYERHSRQELAAAIFYLDDTHEGAATTSVVPGSHRQGEWPRDEQFAIDPALVADRGVPLCAHAGDVAIIHVMVVHRAGENTSDQNRSCIINEYKTQEAVDQWGNPCAFADLPLRRGGKPL